MHPPTQLESLREKAGIAASAEPQGAARVKDLELSVKCEVPGDCDVELNALLGALTIDQQERLSNLNTEILQAVGAMGGCRHKYARERRSSVRRLVS